MRNRSGWGVGLAVLLLVASPVPSQARGHVVVRVAVPLGVPYPYYGYPYAPAPPVVVAQSPPMAVQPPPTQQAAYWYYCPNPPGYYPYIKECPAGWMTVAPSPAVGQPGTQPTQPGGGPGAGVTPSPGTSQLGTPPGQPGSMAYPVPFLTLALSHGQELGLTPDQLQKLRTLRTTADQDAAARSARIRAAQGALNALLAKDKWDLPAIDAKVHELGTLQADMYFADIKTVAAGEALLTPAQLQKLDAIGQWVPSPGGPAAPAPSPPASPGAPPAPH